MHRTTVQVAVEAIIDSPNAYSRSIVLRVQADAIEVGVSQKYINWMLEATQTTCIHEGTFANDRGPDATQRCIHCGRAVPNREL